MALARVQDRPSSSIFRLIPAIQPREFTQTLGRVRTGGQVKPAASLSPPASQTAIGQYKRQKQQGLSKTPGATHFGTWRPSQLVQGSPVLVCVPLGPRRIIKKRIVENMSLLTLSSMAKRARDLGVPLEGMPGAWNAIIDGVAGPNCSAVLLKCSYGGIGEGASWGNGIDSHQSGHGCTAAAESHGAAGIARPGMAGSTFGQRLHHFPHRQPECRQAAPRHGNDFCASERSTRPNLRGPGRGHRRKHRQCAAGSRRCHRRRLSRGNGSASSISCLSNRRRRESHPR